MKYSSLLDLYCPVCGQVFNPTRPQSFCLDCRSPILARYDLPAVKQHVDRDEISRRSRGMWRWHELLPVSDVRYASGLGEGDAPLLHMPRLGSWLGLDRLYVKDESQNPTGTFKARGLAAAVFKAHELGVRKLIIPTAGNAGGALAAYAASCGLEACVIMPNDTPKANVDECRVYGAQLILVEGLISDAAKLAGQMAAQDGWFDVSTFKEPYRVEGKKVMGFELAEAFDWRLPDVIVYPTGGGTGLVGMWKAFDELAALGWLVDGRRPRMISVQAAGCAPLPRAFEQGAERCEFWQGAQTCASGLRVPLSFADRLILQNIRASQGMAIAVTDGEIRLAQVTLGKQEGVFAAPEGGAALAGLEKLIVQGWVRQDERVVLFNTGSGLKYV